MRTKRTRRRWTTEEKRALAAEGHRQTSAGASLRSVALRMGLLEASLRLWMQQHPAPRLAQVHVVEARSSAGPVALVTPDGFRFEGLDLETATAVWERLR